MSDAGDVAARFNEAITAGDLDGLAALMTEDHAFIDAAGVRFAGKPTAVEAWRGFFEAFPGYRNIFETLVRDEDVVTVRGRSECPDARLAGPALWRAVIRDGRVAEWRVYEDTPENRAAVGLT